jgi:hypothetical protein
MNYEQPETDHSKNGNRLAWSALRLVARRLNERGDGRSIALARTVTELAEIFDGADTEARVIAAGFNVAGSLYGDTTHPPHVARAKTCGELAALVYDTKIGLQGAHEREQAAAWWTIVRGLEQRQKGAPPDAAGRYAAMVETWTREAKALDVAATAGAITEEARRVVRGDPSAE